MCDGVLRHVSSIELIPFPSLWNNEQGRGFRLISNFKQDKQCMEDDSLDLKESRDFLEIFFLPSLFYGTQCFPFCLLYQLPHARFHIYTSPSP